MLEYLCLLVGVLNAGLCARSDLVAKNLLLRQQLLVLRRPTRQRPRLRARDRRFWRLIRLVRSDTVVRWHRQGWRYFWWWRSRRPVGRPRVPAEVRGLIAVMSRDNPRWGTERIRRELRKLGIAVSAGSIRRYRWRGPSRPPTQTWRTFLGIVKKTWAGVASGAVRGPGWSTRRGPTPTGRCSSAGGGVGSRPATCRQVSKLLASTSR
jgi:hypothetical protein